VIHLSQFVSRGAKGTKGRANRVGIQPGVFQSGQRNFIDVTSDLRGGKRRKVRNLGRKTLRSSSQLHSSSGVGARTLGICATCR